MFKARSISRLMTSFVQNLHRARIVNLSTHIWRIYFMHTLISYGVMVALVFFSLFCYYGLPLFMIIVVRWWNLVLLTRMGSLFARYTCLEPLERPL